jgi:hypothetical protein
LLIGTYGIRLLIKKLGLRARDHKDDFDNAYNAGLLHHVVDWDKASDRIVLKSSIVEIIRQYLVNSVGRLAYRLRH